MPDLSTALSTASTLANIALVTPKVNIGYAPQPSGATTPLGKSFLFHYEGENQVILESDVTDHAVEDNTFLQDQISIKPEQISVNGFIGELNDVPPAALAPVQSAVQRLTLLAPFTPALSITAVEKYNQAALIYATAAQIASVATQTFASITNKQPQETVSGSGVLSYPVQNKQQLAFTQFYGYWQARQLFTVQTPWAIFQDMVIKSLRAIQEENSAVISNFEISFKKIRTAKVITQKQFKARNLAGRAQAQGSLQVDHGTSILAGGPTLASNLA